MAFEITITIILYLCLWLHFFRSTASRWYAARALCLILFSTLNPQFKQNLDSCHIVYILLKFISHNGSLCLLRYAATCKVLTHYFILHCARGVHLLPRLSEQGHSVSCQNRSNFDRVKYSIDNKPLKFGRLHWTWYSSVISTWHFV